ncbi:uncharacterized protein LOC133186407 [Saccostrea echinata]|uniref:uncharacterized protein LOC133186407 n=1 Tax=Saccostrea echinata TaxID=191078 RepID=UPI002A80BB34|nr:uncharacterized protein LOC133186407 [Saccostrea echinata]
MKKKVTHLGEVGIGSGLSTHASFYEPHVQKTVDTKCGDLKLPYICPVLLPDEYKHLSESLAIDFNEAYKIQEETQEQYNSQRWQLERKKRLTASKFYEILHRKSISLKYVRTILDPKPFNSTSTSYGIANEKKAREMYVKRQGLHVHDCGLCINPEFPFLGATPDGIVCDGGVSGIIEIKCPYTARDLTIEESLSLPNFCLLETDGKISLKKSHAFYFQIQGQPLVTGVTFCDFILFTRKELHVERIHPDVDFMKELGSNLSEIYFHYFHDLIE